MNVCARCNEDCNLTDVECRRCGNHYHSNCYGIHVCDVSPSLIGADPAAAVAVRAISACLLYREWEAAEASGADRPTMGPDRAENAMRLEVWHHNRVVLANRVREAMPPYPARVLAAASGFLMSARDDRGAADEAHALQALLAECADYVATVAMPPVPDVCPSCGTGYPSRAYNPAGDKRCGWCGAALCDTCAEAHAHLGGPYSCGADMCEQARGRGVDPCPQCGETLKGQPCRVCPQCDAWVHGNCLEHHGRRAHCLVGLGYDVVEEVGGTADVEEAMERR